MILFSLAPDGYWLGATDIIEESNFVWPGGIPMAYTYWHSNAWSSQPNDNDNPPQDCLIATSGSDHRWQDKPCEQLKQFLCEVETGISK